MQRHASLSVLPQCTIYPYLHILVFVDFVSSGSCRQFGARFGFRDGRLFVWSYCMRSRRTEQLLHAELILLIARQIRNLVRFVSSLTLPRAMLSVQWAQLAAT